MNVVCEIAPAEKWQADVLVLFVYSGEEETRPEPYAGLEKVMAEAVPWLAGSPAFADFEAAKASTSVAYAPEAIDGGIKRVVLAGLGPQAKCDGYCLREAASAALAKCRSLKCVRAALPLDVLYGLPLEQGKALEEVVFAGLQSGYTYEELKSEKDKKVGFPEELVVLGKADPDQAIHTALKQAQAAHAGVALCKDLVNAPPNVADADYMAEAAKDMADQYGFAIEVMDKDQVKEMGMGAFYAVAQGSDGPANLIVLKTKAATQDNAKPLAVVGKGVTFDTGGISLKPASAMSSMKADMAGAAAVLGLFKALGELGVDIPVLGVVPCTDNMPSGKAFRPEDVVTTLSGKTVEITNTDAEGRLLLCDGLTYAQRFDPSLVVDLATLTGACVIALGNHVAAAFGTSEELAAELRELGDQQGERYWPMPLWDMFFEGLKSPVADMQNSGPREGGAIVAAMFLKQFVEDGVDWLHLDIAGPEVTNKKGGASMATGFGVRTLLALAREKYMQ